MTQPPPRLSQSRPQVLCLAGFMGSGKTTVGTLLARQLAWRFVDLDDRIEAAAGLRIPEIFERLRGNSVWPDRSRPIARNAGPGIRTEGVDRARARRRHVRTARRARIPARCECA